ncbi:39S ribosomal protein L17, mitochondrial [Chionoecetes opilio]|uniref:Large ribosomal subunit protein bL17m n=1 Tax=Chionoecetes opilio TaxID=41210 RepID=A0A8J4YWI7_CHIOP|nr:39S ribosomal protein L17, mitochondrial [Chionoecetes opilio]
MNQAEIRKLIPAVRVVINAKHRRFSNPKGPEGRLMMMRKTVTELVKLERVELNYQRGDEARGYAERLIASAIKNGDCHIPTMEMANYWLNEKQLVHKLFKVLAVRYRDSTESYTKLHKAPNKYPGFFREKAVLELKGNPFPPLEPNNSSRNWIHNILLEEAHQEYIKKKLKEEETDN